MLKLQVKIYEPEEVDKQYRCYINVLASDESNIHIFRHSGKIDIENGSLSKIVGRNDTLRSLRKGIKSKIDQIAKAYAEYCDISGYAVTIDTKGNVI